MSNVALPLTNHLSLLLPELGLDQGETDRPTLRAAICDVAAAAGDAGSIWVLEDLHWADGGTLDVLLELAKVPERSGLSIVATHRSDELPRVHRLRSVRSELRRAGRLNEIVLQPMTREETYRLAEEVAGSSLSEDEEYLKTGNNVESVVTGISMTARVITSAALIMIAVFLSFVMQPDPIIQMFGIGLATAIAIDATIVRVVLVPATMVLLGDANWWVPRWLDRILPEMNLEGGIEPPEPAEEPVKVPSYSGRG